MYADADASDRRHLVPFTNATLRPQAWFVVISLRTPYHACRSVSYTYRAAAAYRIALHTVVTTTITSAARITNRATTRCVSTCRYVLVCDRGWYLYPKLPACPCQNFY